MRYMRRSEEALLVGVVYTNCGCPKPTSFDEALAFRCRCGAAGVLDTDVAERLGKVRRRLALTRRLRRHRGEVDE